MNAACPELGCKQGTKAVPPVPHRLITNVDATFEQNVFDLAQRQRIADIQHHREANDLGRTVEITAGISHRLRLRNSPSPLKPIYSDSASDTLRRLHRRRGVLGTLAFRPRRSADRLPNAAFRPIKLV